MAVVTPGQPAHAQDLWSVREDGALQLNFHAGQVRAWNCDRRFIGVLAGTQSGKALALSTPIPVPGGFKPIGDLHIGDQVFGSNGQPCNVIGVSPVYIGHRCYRVVFDDRTEVIADAEHLWQTQTHKQRKNERRRVAVPDASWKARPQCAGEALSSVATTEQIRATLSDGRGHNNHSVPLCESIQHAHASLPIPPYVLGAWLGDGLSTGACVFCADTEILDEIASEGIPVGVGRACGGGKALRYTIGTTRSRGGDDRTNPVLESLRSLNLINAKHIPDCYLHASPEQRLALLQGLMDTDGTIGRYCEFSSSNERLATQTLMLMRSLGIKARIASRIPKCNGKPASRSWRVTFSTVLPVFRLPRKLARIKPEIRHDALNRYIIAVEPVESVAVRCIAVDSPDALYLCSESYIPTHNTSWGPFWLAREIETRGAGDYIAVTSSYDLFKLKMLPALRVVFEDVLRIGRYWSGDRVIEIADPQTGKFLAKKTDDKMYARIILRSAEAGSGLESSTAKAAWIDEGGQPEFTIETWRAIRRRLSLAQGRALLTTTLYNFGWLKTEWYDRWQKGDTDYAIVQFDSTENPQFPAEEWHAARDTMPNWEFNMQYRGLYERPAGLIYDSFNETLCLVPRIPIPVTWERYLGLDFGGVNTCALFYAHEPGTERYWAYRQYLAGRRTAAEHAEVLKEDEPMIPLCVGGARSEGQWRDEFRACGLPVMEPDIIDVEVGIQRAYGAYKRNEILIFNDLDYYIKQLRSYSRELDDAGQPTEKIEDKEKFHAMDASRYILSYVKRYGDGYLREGSTVSPDLKALFGRRQLQTRAAMDKHEPKPGALSGGLGGVKQGTALFGAGMRRGMK